jgi:hypothetical protein
MPRVFRDEYRSALLKRVTHIVQDENSAALQNVEGFVHMEVAVDGDARTERHLLGPQGETVRACGGADLNEDVPVVTKMNEMFTFGGTDHISLRGRIDFSHGSSCPGCAHSLQKAATAMFDVHRNLPRSGILPWRHGSVAVDNGCEQEEKAVFGVDIGCASPYQRKKERVRLREEEAF